MRSLRILLVDDDALIGVLLTEILEDMGHVVCGLATTETEAVQAAIQARPDLMIVDANLRAGSGMAAVKQIGRAAVIPHIFMSGGRLPAAMGAAVTLQKPFMPRDLVVAIERAIRAFPVAASQT